MQIGFFVLDDVEAVLRRLVEDEDDEIERICSGVLLFLFLAFLALALVVSMLLVDARLRMAGTSLPFDDGGTR